MVVTKVCKKCGVEKDASAFSRHINTRDGLKSWCKACLVSSAQASAARNPEKVRGHKQGWKDRNPERVRAQQRKDNAKAYKRRGPQIRAYNRAYHAIPKNKAKIHARITSPEGRLLRRFYQQRRNARIKGTPSNLTPAMWATILERFGHQCAYCPAPWQEIDHIVPVSRGGGLVMGNVVPACKPCNVAKNAQSLDIFCTERALDPTPILALAAMG